jgi:Taurine catabolism dioxygenase TauD, TfdA family
MMTGMGDRDDAMQPMLLAEWDLVPILDHLRMHGMVMVRDRHATSRGFIDWTSVLMDALPQSAVAAKERDSVSPAYHVATVNKGVDPVPLHREASFVPTQPDLLAFYCEQPPDSGGQTILCDGVALLQALPGDVQRFVVSHSLDWMLQIPGERWRVAFGCDTPQDAARRIDELMARAPTATYQYQFDGDWLVGTYRCPLVLPTFWGGQPAFCNSVLGYYFRDPGPYVAKHLHAVGLAPDRRPIPADILEAVRADAEALTVEVKWRAGDIVLVDNSHVMHGRRAVTDPVRRIHLRFGNYRPGLDPRR